MTRIDPNNIAIKFDWQRLELAELVDLMETNTNPLMQVYAARIRAVLDPAMYERELGI